MATNYPDNVSPTDPYFFEKDPWEKETCGSCSHFCSYPHVVTLITRREVDGEMVPIKEIEIDYDGICLLAWDNGWDSEVEPASRQMMACSEYEEA